MADDWYYAQNQERRGPVSFAKLKTMASDGWLRREDLVWNAGMPEWTPAEEIPCDLPIDPEVIQAAAPYPADAKPVFMGHYWLPGSRPELLAGNVACVDWSVAKGGFLCAYRWDGEQELDVGKFVWTAA